MARSFVLLMLLRAGRCPARRNGVFRLGLSRCGRRFVQRRRLLRLNGDAEDCPSRLDLVPVLKVFRPDPLAVHEGTIAAADVHHPAIRRVYLDEEMKAREVFIFRPEPEVGESGATDEKVVMPVEGEHLALVRPFGYGKRDTHNVLGPGAATPLGPSLYIMSKADSVLKPPPDSSANANVSYGRIYSEPRAKKWFQNLAHQPDASARAALADASGWF